MSSTLRTDQDVARLCVMCEGRELQTRVLQDGDRLVLGADDSADIVLTGDDVASTHCLLTAENGLVRVRDCYSTAGTMVNGHTVREMELSRDADIQIDRYEIRVVLTAPKSQTIRPPVFIEPPKNEPEQRSAEEPDFAQESAPVSIPEPAPEVDESTNAHPPVDLVSDESLMSQLHRIQLELIQTRTENRILAEQLEQAQQNSQEVGGETDPFQDEMVELLKAEVIDLQNALAAQQEASGVASSDTSADDEVVSQEEAERLMGRLEELLAELQERDDQVATLTELLEATEDSQDAEETERSQINDWLSEIEERFSHREVEWEAQSRQLQQQLEQVTAERDRAEEMARAENTDARLQATQEVLSGLRDTAERQRQQLDESQKEVARLSRELESRGQELDREERIRLAEEKAEVARQRQELEAARHLTRSKENNESTLKLQALRAHLNEIHAKEQQEQEERKLRSRLSRLWKRLEGR